MQVCRHASMSSRKYVVTQVCRHASMLSFTYVVKSLNEGLSALIKTKAGLTRKIQRDTGGKQGGKLIVPLFAKTMDTLPEEMIQQDELGAQFGDLKIPCLVYMDDAISFAEEYTQQELRI